MTMRLRLALFPALLFLIAGLSPAQTSATAAPPADALTKERKEEILSALENVVTRQAFVPGVDLAKWPDFLERQREAIDQSEGEADFARAVNAALRNFGISHIRFLPPRVAANRNRTTTVGVGVAARHENDRLVVTQVFAGSPAEQAGLKLGDAILLVDGVAPDSAAVLSGDENTKVTLRVRSADGAEREVRLARATYSIARIDTLTWLDDEAAVLRVHTFNRGYNRAGIEALVQEAAKAKYLVLDLRSNGGGATTNLQHLLSLLMPPNTEIGTFVNRQTATQHAERNGGVVETDPVAIAREARNKYRTRKLEIPPFEGRIAVLINRGSASASEICASALRESRDAVIVGQRSAGAVLASVFRRLPHGYEIQYPVSDYVSKDGVRLERNPIVPDVEITGRAEEGTDPFIEAALARLRARE
jgi:carboxyl-terminal processing protease